MKNKFLKACAIKFMGFVALLLAGCASGDFHGYLAKTDQFHPDVVRYFSDPIGIKDINFLNPLSGATVSNFKLNYIKDKNSTFWYIDTFYRSSGWLFVNTLRFVVDGKIYAFPSNPSPDRETGVDVDAYVQETNTFQVTDDFIDALQKAKSVTVRLEGDHYYEDKALSAKDIANITWFINYAKTQMANAN